MNRYNFLGEHSLRKDVWRNIADIRTSVTRVLNMILTYIAAAARPWRPSAFCNFRHILHRTFSILLLLAVQLIQFLTEKLLVYFFYRAHLCCRLVLQDFHLRFKQCILNLKVFDLLLHGHVLRGLDLNDSNLVLTGQFFSSRFDQVHYIDFRVFVKFYKEWVVLGRVLKFLFP